MKRYAVSLLVFVVLISVAGCGGGGGSLGDGSLGGGQTQPPLVTPPDGSGGQDDTIFPPSIPDFPTDTDNGDDDNGIQPGTPNVFTGRVIDNINENSYSGFVVRFGASGMYSATTEADGRFTLNLPANVSYFQVYVAGGGKFILRDTSTARQVVGVIYAGRTYDPEPDGNVYLDMPENETWELGIIRVQVLLNPPS